jgi:hypothetical protein
MVTSEWWRDEAPVTPPRYPWRHASVDSVKSGPTRGWRRRLHDHYIVLLSLVHETTETVAALSASMPLTMEEVTRISEDAAHDVSPDLQVVGVTLTGGSGYTEILVTLRGCQAEPCQVAVGAFRDTSESAMRQEIVETLRRHVAQHREPQD